MARAGMVTSGWEWEAKSQCRSWASVTNSVLLDPKHRPRSLFPHLGLCVDCSPACLCPHPPSSLLFAPPRKSCRVLLSFLTPKVLSSQLLSLTFSLKMQMSSGWDGIFKIVIMEITLSRHQIRIFYKALFLSFFYSINFLLEVFSIIKASHKCRKKCFLSKTKLYKEIYPSPLSSPPIYFVGRIAMA